MAEDPRLERVEKHIDKLGDKIDELTKVVTAMARIEERMVTLFKRMDIYDARGAALDERVGVIEKTVTKTGVVDQVLEKGFWVVVGGGIAFIVKVLGE
jgi:Uri superfamily endonuclease